MVLSIRYRGGCADTSGIANTAKNIATGNPTAITIIDLRTIYSFFADYQQLTIHAPMFPNPCPGISARTDYFSTVPRGLLSGT